MSLRDALMQPRNGQNLVLESLSDEEFKQLARDLPGTVINREEVVFVEPDPDYFTKLAAARGDGADRAFFSALKATYPELVWPVYAAISAKLSVSACSCPDRSASASLAGRSIGYSSQLHGRIRSLYPR